jgi:hypothetical protein
MYSPEIISGLYSDSNSKQITSYIAGGRSGNIIHTKKIYSFCIIENNFSVLKRLPSKNKRTVRDHFIPDLNVGIRDPPPSLIIKVKI